MLPERDLDDLFGNLVSRLVDVETRVAALEKIEIIKTRGQMRIYDDGIESYIAIKFTAQSNVLHGDVVCFDQSNNQRVKPVPTGGNEHDMPMGVGVENIDAGRSGWVAIIGLVFVNPDDAITAVRGYVLTTSTTTAGRVAQTATVPAAAVHFDEVGHWYEDGSGNGKSSRAIIHFN
jgi:hypothetical protein